MLESFIYTLFEEAQSLKKIALAAKNFWHQKRGREGGREKEEERERERIRERHHVTFCPFYPAIFLIFFSLSSYTRRRQFLSKALVYYRFLVFRRIGEHISQDLFLSRQILITHVLRTSFL